MMAVEYRCAENNDRLSTLLAADLIHRRVANAGGSKSGATQIGFGTTIHPSP